MYYLFEIDKDYNYVFLQSSYFYSELSTGVKILKKYYDNKNYIILKEYKFFK